MNASQPQIVTKLTTWSSISDHLSARSFLALFTLTSLQLSQRSHQTTPQRQSQDQEVEVYARTPTMTRAAGIRKKRGNNEARLLVKHVFPHGKICMLTNERWAKLHRQASWPTPAMEHKVQVLHPSWSQMKQDLTYWSNWPFQPLGEEDRIKDVKEILVFGIHKGAVQQQGLLKMLETSKAFWHLALLLPLKKGEIS